jgi:hypothetical protein
VSYGTAFWRNSLIHGERVFILSTLHRPRAWDGSDGDTEGGMRDREKEILRSLCILGLIIIVRMHV